YTPTDGRVPNCYGMTAKDAIAMLHAAGYKVRLSGYGKVRSQNPRAGQELKSGSTVEITLR
ncbi:MAG: PASTA domain-containing protein, partial [Bacteroidaceae bacterium]|nr:PASTA domain-containing protein [Bacteroidaceae bacterium]